MSRNGRSTGSAATICSLSFSGSGRGSTRAVTLVGGYAALSGAVRHQKQRPAWPEAFTHDLAVVFTATRCAAFLALTLAIQQRFVDVRIERRGCSAGIRRPEPYITEQTVRLWVLAAHSAVRRSHRAQQNPKPALCATSAAPPTDARNSSATAPNNGLSAKNSVSPCTATASAGRHGALRGTRWAMVAAVYVELTTTRQAAQQFEPAVERTSNIQAIVRLCPAPWPPRVA